MKIALIIPHPEKGSPACFERTYQIAKHISKDDDIQTTILTPYTDDLRIVDDVDVKLIQTTMSKFKMDSIGYNLVRKMMNSPLTSRFVLSERSILTMAKRIRTGVKKILLKEKYDLIFAVQGISGLACGPLAKEMNIPLITELDNGWPEEAVANGFAHEGDKTFNQLKKYEQMIIDSSDKLVLISDFHKSLLQKNYSIKNDKMVVVPGTAPIVTKNTETRRDPNVIYTGTVHPRAHVDLFAKSIKFVKNPANFFISNNGDVINEVKKITSAKGYPKVNYVWFKKREELFDFFLTSKVGVVTFQDDITWKIGISQKALLYMSCGLPIVSNDIGNWLSDVIKKEKVGLMASKDDPKDFAEKIDMLLSDENLWSKLHENGIKLINSTYNWNKICNNILIPMILKFKS